jgi:hypothetical protein
MNQGKRFKGFLNITIRTLDYDIRYESVLGIRGKKYYITDAVKDLLHNEIEMKLYERIEPFDVSLVFIRSTHIVGLLV